MTVNIATLIKKFKDDLEGQNISQEVFANSYYGDIVPFSPEDGMLNNHYETFKGLLAQHVPKRPERIFSYIDYFNRKYKHDGTHTQADRNAAWEFYVELDTRIATKALPDDSGVESAALKSLYELFNLHRTISKAHGSRARGYYQLVDQYVEEDLRPFTAKWHKELSDDNKTSFRQALKDLQGKMQELKQKLRVIIDPAHEEK